MDMPRASRTGTFGVGIDWAWALLAGLLVTAAGYLLMPETDLDGEFPGVIRPTFSRYAPAAYRFAEPGDTLDRVGIYLASGAGVLAMIAAFKAWRFGFRWRARGWSAAVALTLGAFWFSANPGPSFDDWHGANFNVVANPDAPGWLRLAVLAWGALLAMVAAWGGRALAGMVFEDRRVVGLSVVAASLVLVRVVEWPNPEPIGYWPRWAWVIGLSAWAVVLGRCARRSAQERAERRGVPDARVVRLATFGVLAAGGVGLTCLGLTLTWYHRPIDRLRAIVPGKIYISAIPTPEGLAVAHARHRFKTIINLFPERTSLRSPLFDKELAFARTHGIRLIENPHLDERSGDFVDETLRMAQDPATWPVLVHCHACMDRTPAWMGMYRFLVQGKPLAEVFREIERHRGCRPKASVTLLYTHLLPSRSNGRFDADPTGPLLRRIAGDSLHVFEERPPTVPRLGARPVGDIE